MANRLRTLGIAVLVIGFAGSAFAEEPIPPLPLAGESKSGFRPDPSLPVEHSPCTFDLDAGWLLPLKTTAIERVKIKVPQPVNCDGAVIKSIAASGGGSVTTLEFTVGFRPGHDRDGTISFAIFDDDKQPVALAEASDNLDEGKDSYLRNTLTIKNREFARVFAKGQKPILRVTLRVGQ